MFTEKLVFLYIYKHVFYILIYETKITVKIE